MASGRSVPRAFGGVCISVHGGLVTGNMPTRRVTFVRRTGGSGRGTSLFTGIHTNGIHILLNSARGVNTNAGIRSGVVTSRSVSYP